MRSVAFADPPWRWLWLAAACSSAAGVVAAVANTWAVTGLSISPGMAGWIQAAPALPACLLAIPGALLAKVWERRRLMLALQSLSLGVLAALLAQSASGRQSTTSLLGLAILGCGCAALTGTALGAVVPSLVPTEQLGPARRWDALSRDLARMLAAWVAGLVLACLGGSAAYALALAGTVAALVGLARLPPFPVVGPDSLAEEFIGALRAELRYARASRELRRSLSRLAAFFFCAGAGWAMLPLVMRHGAPDAPGLYGLALAGIGGGIAAGRWLLSSWQRWLTADALMGCAGLSMAGALAVLAAGPTTAVALLLMPLVGMADVTVLTLLGRSIRSRFPAWVRGRGRGLYLTVLNGGLAVGCGTWGLVAEYLGVSTALAVSALLLFLVTCWGRLLHSIG